GSLTMEGREDGRRLLPVLLVKRPEFCVQRSLFQAQAPQQHREEEARDAKGRPPGVANKSEAEQFQNHREVNRVAQIAERPGLDKLVILPNLHMQAPEPA